MRKLQIVGALGLVVLVHLGGVWAVQTSYIEHNTEKQFKGGDPNGVLISSRGELTLGQDTETLLSEEGDVWLVNAMVKGKDGSVYAATSGEGYIYRLRRGKEPEVIYGKGKQDQKHIFSLAIDDKGRLLAGTGGNKGLLLRFGKGDKPEVLLDEEEIKYVWGIEVGPAGRLYLATGPTGMVLTLDSQGKKKEELFKAKEKNILCLALDAEGMLYAGGDDKGLIYRIDPGSKEVRIVYETGHAEVSALVFDEEGNLYASTADASAARPGVKLILSDGETSRPEEKKKQEKPEEKLKIKNEKLKIEEDSKAKSKEIKPKREEKEGKDEKSGPKEPEEKEEKTQPEGVGKEKEEKAAKPAVGAKESKDKEDNAKLKIKNEKIKEEEKKKKKGIDKNKASSKAKISPRKVTPPATPEQIGSSPSSRPPMHPPSGAGPTKRPPAKENDVYQISPSGFVQKIFSKAVVILDMAYGGDGQLYLGTGNEAQLLRLDVNRQEAAVLHEAKPSVQVSALCVADGTVYAGLANPGGLLAIREDYVRQGYFESDVIDVEQITQWGKLHLDVDIPDGSGVWVATRSGNTSDPKNGGWSDWSDSRQVETDIPIDAEPGRFLQYRLTLSSFDGKATPTIREVKLAHMIPNLPPKLSDLTVKRGASSSSSSSSTSKGAGAKTFSVTWKAEDANKDKLKYEVYLRELGRKNWVRVAKDLDKSPYNWNSETAADGRYEFKVEASDEASNPSGTGLTDSRVSLPVVVDNTPPDVVELGWKIEGKKVSVTAKLRDALSAIGKVDFSVDSAEEWKVAVAADGVYDSREETVKFNFEVEEAGEHLLSIRFEDALGNQTYRNVRLETN